jgi:hypothetical protein
MVDKIPLGKLPHLWGESLYILSSLLAEVGGLVAFQNGNHLIWGTRNLKEPRGSLHHVDVNVFCIFMSASLSGLFWLPGLTYGLVYPYFQKLLVSCMPPLSLPLLPAFLVARSCCSSWWSAGAGSFLVRISISGPRRYRNWETTRCPDTGSRRALQISL